MSHALPHAHVPVIGFVAYSGTGKTTLLTRLIPLLRAHAVRVAAIKHSHHKFDVDTPGKDSYELRKAGANQMLVASSKRWALMVENNLGENSSKEPSLNNLIHQLDQSCIDLILVEGFKHENFAKIELHRPELGHDLLYPGDKNIVAFCSTDKSIMQSTGHALPFLDINQPATIVDFLINQFNLKTSQTI